MGSTGGGDRRHGRTLRHHLRLHLSPARRAAALLGGLAAQRFAAVPRPRFDVVIVDNEGSSEAAAICAKAGPTTGLAVRYVQEPRRGISYARNTCLDHVARDAEFFAMIDDDEVPELDWLEQLLCAQARAGADVVRGAVVPVFPESAPAWIRDGDFFGWPKQRRVRAGTALSDGAELTSASSNNALVRAAAVRALDLRFDPTLALTGGEDALFFRQMKLAGCKIIYASGARVREAVSPDRATFTYLWRVHYRQGCNKVPRKLRLETRVPALAVRAHGRQAHPARMRGHWRRRPYRGEVLGRRPCRHGTAQPRPATYCQGPGRPRRSDRHTLRHYR